MSGETESQPSGWQLDTLKEYFERRLGDNKELLDERFATQIKAGEVALTAQQTAMRTALEAAEKAVNTALVSAEKAVTKAEVAADKRFEAMNEFRGQLADQAATLISRSEAEVRIQALAEKLETSMRQMESWRNETTSRLDVAQGNNSGSSEERNDRRMSNSGIAALVGAVVGVLGIVLAIVTIIIANKP